MSATNTFMDLSHSNSRLVLVQALSKNIINRWAIKTIISHCVFESHMPDSPVHPFTRITQIINNGLPLVLIFSYIKYFISGRNGGLRFGLPYVGKTRHRPLRNMKHAMINMIAGCLLCQLICSPIVMSRYMSNAKIIQIRNYI